MEGSRRRSSAWCATGSSGANDGTVLLASRRRVRIQRPFHEPVVARTPAVASDDPDDLIARLLAPAPSGVDVWTLAWTAELATLARDAAQPG